MKPTEKVMDLVLPCYNPQPDWARRVVAAMNGLAAQLPDWKICLYVVNDGSLRHVSEQDVAYLRAEIPHFQWITYPLNRGKGYALRQGVAATLHEFCIYTDIDFPYTEASFLRVAHALTAGAADVVVAVREPNYYQRVPPMRVFISKLLKWLIRNFLRLAVDDTQGGLKGFNAKGRAVFLRTTLHRYLFDLEFVYLVGTFKGLRLLPVVVELKEGIVFSNMNPKILFTEGLSFLKLLFRRHFGSL